MKLPNSYGSVLRLKGKRRKPYAVRISCGYRERICLPNKAECYKYIDRYGMKFRKDKNDYVVDGTDAIKETLDKYNIPYKIEYVRKFRYLQYFERSRDAHDYLARYNRGDVVSEHVSKTSEPSFKDVFDMYVDFIDTLNKKPSETTLRADRTGFKNWSDVHDLRFRSITTKQLQKCLTAHGTMSKSTVNRMLTVLKKLYKFAIANEICEKDLSLYLFKEYTDEQKYVHVAYSDDEIEKLWNTDTEAAWVSLILIYSGMRCSEFLRLKTENIHLEERYIIGGIKTKAGRDRIIPIHKKLVPVIRKFYNPENKYLFPNDEGGCMLYSHFRENKWEPYQEELGMNHLSHDCRHTCASKLEEAGVSDFHRKLILGHSIRDLTNGTYTHVAKERLIADMDMWK